MKNISFQLLILLGPLFLNVAQGEGFIYDIIKPGQREFIQDLAGLIDNGHKQEIKEAANEILTKTGNPIIVVTIKKMREEVINTASKIFYDQRVHHTSSESGLLIFISFFEKRAVILGDEKIEKDLGIDTIETLCQKLTASLKEKNNPADSMIEIIEEAGSLLADILPRNDSDENELSDALVCID